MGLLDALTGQPTPGHAAVRHCFIDCSDFAFARLAHILAAAEQLGAPAELVREVTRQRELMLERLDYHRAAFQHVGEPWVGQTDEFWPDMERGRPRPPGGQRATNTGP
jgi:hypothetical protein